MPMPLIALAQTFPVIPDTIMPRVQGHEPETLFASDSLLRVRVDSVIYEQTEDVLLVTVPLPEKDTRAYIYNKLSGQYERAYFDGIDEDALQFCNAEIETVNPILLTLTIREAFVPKDEEYVPKVIRGVKLRK